MTKFLKILIIGVLVFCGTSVEGIAQNGCGTSYAKGQKFFYSRVDAPDPLSGIPDYWKLKGKEKKAAEEKFNAGVANGTIQGKKYDFEMEISDMKAAKNGNMYEFEYATPAAKYHSYVICKNDTMYGIRSLTGTPLISGKDTIGFMKLGIVQYPVNMKIGDVLPVTTDLNYTFPKDIDASYKRKILDHVTTTSSSRESQGYIYTTTSTTQYFKEITQHLSYTIQFSAPTNTYRHVVAEENITVGGKSYKAYKIELVLETKVGDMISNIEADDKLMKWTLEFTNNYIKRNVNKAEGLKHTGNEWFVPELGAVAISEILDKDGKSLYKSVLNKIE